MPPAPADPAPAPIGPTLAGRDGVADYGPFEFPGGIVRWVEFNPVSPF